MRLLEVLFGYQQLVGHEKKGHNYILTIRETPGIIEKALGAKIKDVDYYGKCTVWYRMPDMERCSTLKQGYLNGRWQKVKYEEKNDSITETIDIEFEEINDQKLITSQ